MKKIFSILMILLVSAFCGFGGEQDKDFKDIVRIPASPVKDQQKTGTCWSFATASFLESEVLRKGKGEFDLSEMFFVRHAYMQKAERYLLYHGHANFSQGGQAHDVMNVVREFGIFPEFGYTGDPLNPGIHDHDKMVNELTKFIVRTNENFGERKAEKWKEKFNQILDTYLGKVPEEFGVKGQIYSPEGFTDYLEIDPDDYLEFTSFTHHPFYEQIDLEIPDNWSHDKYINVPIQELVEITDSALFHGYSVCWDGDTSEKGFSRREGVATLEGGITPDQAARQTTFLNRQTTDDHLMHILGIAEDRTGEKYYIIKNSWGTGKSKFNGFLYMSVPYMKLKTIAILVHKDAVPLSVMGKINNK